MGFQKLKDDAERERINKLEEVDRKANIQLERQLVMASDWSRALLTMRGKLKSTEWDPENSHRIDYGEFLRFLTQTMCSSWSTQIMVRQYQVGSST